MHRVLIAVSLLALCGFATAQVTVISGYASNWAPGYSVYQTPGAYAAPFVPLVTTPSVSIETGLPTQVGARNATTGNVAGSTNATMSITAPGAYAAPFVPLVTTPSVSIETGLPTQIGASNATTGNVAGATNSTISLVAPNIVAPNMSVSPVVRAAPGTELGQQYGAGTQSVTPPTNDRLELGAASFQASRGAAQLISSRQQQKPARTITNDDIDRLNQQNGTVQFKGKTEKIE
ncbi:MAG TPA: hypothetical protein VGV15_14475 [Terriglobales bacterium]|nr:hypothetical protein [Terriglobales bacterium]